MKSCFVTLSGPTNSGKSTLLNSLLNKKVSIVSKKIQTTNFNVEFALNYKNCQINFIDTPGFYKDNVDTAEYSPAYFDFNIFTGCSMTFFAFQCQV